MFSKLTISIVIVIILSFEANFGTCQTSFKLVKSEGFDYVSTLEAIHYAKEATTIHGMEINEIVEYMQTKLQERDDRKWNCFVSASFGVSNSGIAVVIYTTVYFYIKSDEFLRDTHIFCFQNTLL